MTVFQKPFPVLRTPLHDNPLLNFIESTSLIIREMQISEIPLLFNDYLGFLATLSHTDLICSNA